MPYLRHLIAFIQTEPGRIFATATVVLITFLLVKLLQLRARTSSGPQGERGMHRRTFVLAKNLILVIALVAILGIWATKIAGAALSLAAVAGAILIVSKEFLANLLGSFSLAISRVYSIGDFIEVDGNTGRVVDSDMFSTTLAETLEGSQITGRTVTIPNSVLLAKPVRNLTATGRFVINLLTVSVDPTDDIEAHERALLGAANQVCDWQQEAETYLKHVESRELVDLPSAQAKVILQLDCPGVAKLSLRYACRPNDKVWVEQMILRCYLEARPKSAEIRPMISGDEKR
jgi:small-conductance mechanosensitive channel